MWNASNINLYKQTLPVLFTVLPWLQSKQNFYDTESKHLLNKQHVTTIYIYIMQEKCKNVSTINNNTLVPQLSRF